MNFQEFSQSIASPGLRAVAAHWWAIRGSAQMPSWEQLRPAQMTAQLPWLWAYKYDPHTGKFRGRLAGNRITFGLGKNFRGMPLEDAHSPTTLPWVQRAMTRIVCEPAAFRSAGKLFKRGERIVEGERIMLPLAGDGVHGDGILGVSEYEPYRRGQDDTPFEALSDIEVWCPLTVTSPALA